jgi:hypothetical protein
MQSILWPVVRVLVGELFRWGLYFGSPSVSVFPDMPDKVLQHDSPSHPGGAAGLGAHLGPQKISLVAHVGLKVAGPLAGLQAAEVGTHVRQQAVGLGGSCRIIDCRTRGST